eukprot:1057339-Prorocentrum_minimum.AAC.1
MLAISYPRPSPHIPPPPTSRRLDPHGPWASAAARSSPTKGQIFFAVCPNRVNLNPVGSSGLVCGCRVHERNDEHLLAAGAVVRWGGVPRLAAPGGDDYRLHPRAAPQVGGGEGVRRSHHPPPRGGDSAKRGDDIIPASRAELSDRLDAADLTAASAASRAELPPRGDVGHEGPVKGVDSRLEGVDSRSEGVDSRSEG